MQTKQMPASAKLPLTGINFSLTLEPFFFLHTYLVMEVALMKAILLG